MGIMQELIVENNLRGSRAQAQARKVSELRKTTMNPPLLLPGDQDGLHDFIPSIT